MGAESAQMLRYAADLARLYRTARDDRRQHQQALERLQALEATCLGLVRCLSAEDAAGRVARAGVDMLGLASAAVYLDRGDRFTLAARHPEGTSFPAQAEVRRADLDPLGAEPDEFLCAPWAGLVPGAPATVVPLSGRRHAIGFVVGAGSLGDLTLERERWVLSLLTGHAGVVLENFLLEERRGPLAAGLPAAGPPPAGVPAGLVGRCPAMQRVLGLVGRLGPVEAPVLLTGETGTGKSLLARALHESGPRREGPFVTLNCGAIPEALVESELFGHEAGAFTGALRRHRGRVEQAAGGTLFLDEIGELPPAAQVKLLHFLEERRFTRVGGEGELSADVRVVAATNRDLEGAVRSGGFRSDLYYRLNVFTLEMPPLRERGRDVVLLARHLAREVAARHGLPEPELGPEAEGRLLAYAWPGNVRELRNVVEKALILAGDGPLSPDVLPGPDGDPAAPPRPTDAGLDDAEPIVLEEGCSFSESKQRVLERWETATIQALLERTGGNIAQAARLAQLDKKNLHRKLKRYGIDARAHRAGRRT